MARKIELKTVPLGEPGNDGETLDYRETLVTILRQPSGGQGIDYEEMGRRLKLIEKVQSAKKHVVLEDAEWDQVVAAFKAFRFAQVLTGVVRMGDDLTAAEEVPIGGAHPRAGAPSGAQAR